MRKLLLISGMPATGKSTLARRIGEELHFPILEKDEIKEVLFDTLGYADLKEKRRLDTIATAVLLQTAEKLLQSGVDLILVNNFESSMAPTVDEMIARCEARCITLFLNGDAEVLYQRYVERDRKKSRHQGHTFIDRYPPLPEDDVNRSMTRQYFADRFEKEGMNQFSIRGARIDVDSTYPDRVDGGDVIRQIWDYFETAEGDEK